MSFPPRFNPQRRFYEVLVETSLDIITVIDADGKIVFESPSIGRVLGYTPEQLLARNAFEFIHEDDQAAVRNALANLADDENHIETTKFRFRHADNSWRMLRSIGRRLPSGSGVDGIIVNSLDVTDEVAAVEALRESRLRFKDLAETVPDWLWEVDDELRFTYASPRIRDLLGFEPEEVLGRKPFDFMSPAEAERVQALATSILAEHMPLERLEATLLHKDGRTVNIETSGVPIFGVDGAFSGYRGIDRNITDRKRAEAALRGSETRFHDLAETIPDWIWEADEHLRFTYSNPSVQHVLGYTAEDVLGLRPYDFMTPDEANRIRTLGPPTLVPHMPFSRLENVMSHKDGHAVIVEASGVPILSGDGHFRGYRGIAHDVTEAREAQRRIEDLSRFPAENPNPVMRVTAAGQLLYANEATKGSKLVLNGKLAPKLRTEAECASKAGEDRKVEFRSGRRIFSVTLTPVEGQEYVNLYCNDITEIRRAQEELRLSQTSLARVNRLLELIRKCNAALVRTADEAELLHSICRLIVGEGDYLLAWVGYTEDDAAKSVAPMAVEGPAAELVQNSDVTWGESKDGVGAIATAINTNKSVTVNAISTTTASVEWRDEAVRHGLASFTTIPLCDANGAFSVLNVGSADPDRFDAEEISMLKELANDLAFGIVAIHERTRRSEAEVRQSELERKTEQALFQAIEAIALAAEARDPYTAGHEREVARLAEAIAREMGLSEYECAGIRVAGSLHDIGKLNVPMEILAKPTVLNEPERTLVMTHAEHGYRILKGIEFPWPVADMVRQHHERLDGSGYPLGLTGEQMLLGARILAVADTVEAMGSHRPYRPSRGVDGALLHVLQEKGHLFDAGAVDACLRLFNVKGYRLGVA